MIHRNQDVDAPSNPAASSENEPRWTRARAPQAPERAPNSHRPSERPIIVDVFNVEHAARVLGMRRAELINQTGRYENVFICADGPAVKTLRDHGIRVFTTPIPRSIAPVAMYRCARRIAKILRPLNCSIVHSHGSTASVCARLAARQARVPFVVHTIHGFHFHEGMNPLTRAAFIWAEKVMMPYTDVLLFQNKEDEVEAERLGIRAPLGNVRVGNGIDLRPFASLPPEKADPPAIVMVARFEPVKNQSMLLRAGKLLAERGDKFQLWFVGGSTLLEEHKQLAIKLGIADRTRFFGHCMQVAPIIAQATIGTLSSIKEGIPRGLLEPMAAGLPAVATDVKGNRETVVHGETGFLVPLNDDEALAGALHALLADPELRRRQGARAAEWVRQNFNEERVVDRLLDIYDSLLARQAAQV